MSLLPDTGSPQASIPIHRAGLRPSSASTQEEEIAGLPGGNQQSNNIEVYIYYYSHNNRQLQRMYLQWSFLLFDINPQQNRQQRRILGENVMNTIDISNYKVCL